MPRLKPFFICLLPLAAALPSRALPASRASLDSAWTSGDSLNLARSKLQITRALLVDHDSGYEELRRHLPLARRLDSVGALFGHFLGHFTNCGRAFDKRSTALVRKWVREAVKSGDEDYRLWHSLGMNAIRQVDAGGVTLDHFLIRPGGSVEITWYDPRGKSPPPDDMRVEIAMLERDARGKPLRYRPGQTGGFRRQGLFHVFQRRIDSAGTCRVTVWNRDFFQQAYVQVTALDMALKDDGETLLAWGASPGNRVPPPYRLRITGPGGLVRDTLTDSSGLLTLKLPRGGVARGDYRFRMEKDGHLSFNRAEAVDTSGEAWATYLYTDRPRYRPGDWIHFRGLVKRHVDDRSLADGWQRGMEVEIRDGRGEQALLREVAVDAWGMFGDSLLIPETGALGEWEFLARQPEIPGSRPLYLERGSAVRFRVEEYRKPDFQLEGRAEFRPTVGKVKLLVQGLYYSGSALANAPVVIDWRGETLEHHWHGIRGWDGYRRSWRQPSTRRSGEILRRDTLVLDARGRAILEIPSPLPVGSHALIAEMKARDITGREVRAEAKVLLLKGKGALEGVTDKFRYQAGDQGWLRISAMGSDGEALQGKATVRIERDGRPWLDTVLRVGAEGVPPLRLPLVKTGQYAARIALDGGRAGVLNAETRFLVVHLIGSGPEAAIRILPDRGRFSSGDSLGFALSGRWGDSPLLVTLEGAHLGGYKVVRAPGNRWVAGRIAIAAGTYKQAKIAVLYPGPLGWEGDSAAVTLTDSAFFLKASLEADATWKPGDRFRGRLRVRDAAGRPARVRFTLGVVDEAIYAGQPPPADSMSGLIPGQARNRVRTRLGDEPRDWLWGLSGPGEVPHLARELWRSGWRKEWYDFRFRSDETKPRRKRGAHFEFGPVLRPMAWSQFVREDTAYVVMKLSGNPMDFGPAGAEPVPIRERSEFRDLAWWAPALETDASGSAQVEFTLPDDLTRWRLSAKGAGAGSALLDFTGQIRTRQDLSVRLAVPRVLVSGDSALVSAVLHNSTDRTVEAVVRLESGDTTRVLPADSGIRQVSLPPGTLGVTVPFRVLKSGRSGIRATVSVPGGGDAEFRSVPVELPGIRRTESAGGVLDSAPVEWAWTPAPSSRAGPTFLKVEAYSRPFGSLLSAVDGLLEYPYGCVEQTLSRFVPLVQLGAALDRAGLRDTARDGKIRSYAKAGLDRLASMQRLDGSWGWWARSDFDARMTALVVEGLALARQGGLPPSLAGRADNLLAAGTRALEYRMDAERASAGNLVLIAHAVSRSQPPARWKPLLERAWPSRDSLSTRSLAQMLELLHSADAKARCQEILGLLAKRVHLADLKDRSRPRAYRNEQETGDMAAVLGALLTADPGHALVPRIASWLHRNRSGEGWGSTRTTSEVIAALGRHSETSDGRVPGGRLEIVLNGRTVGVTEVRPGPDGTFAWTLALDPEAVDSLLVREGPNRLALNHAGPGRLYFTARTTWSAQEPPGLPEAKSIGLKRYYRKVRYVQRASGWERRTSPLGDSLKTVQQGDEVEVELHVEAKKDLDYLLVEDFFPAGMEYLDRGEAWRRTHAVNWYGNFDQKEVRDDRVAFFQTRLPQGKTVFTYLLRAETPGRFHARPARAELMYETETAGYSTPAHIAVKRRVLAHQ